VDEPFPLTRIIDLATYDDVRWCLRLTPEVSRWFACDCVEHVLPVFEKARPGDGRVRVCLETTRRYLAGLIPKSELMVARSAAYTAADAYTAAAYTAAAAYAAADAAAYADAAYTAAAYTAAAVYAAAYAERHWQLGRLRQYWSGQVPAPLTALGLNTWTDYRRAK
jgi:hypothetical protein